jgi:hypothetical protein
VIYTVTAADGSTQKYTVVLNVLEPEPEPDQEPEPVPDQEPEPVPELGQGLIHVSFEGPEDEAITLVSTQSLSWQADTQLNVSVSGTGFTVQEWYLDGVPQTPDGLTAAASFNITPQGNLALGQHRLSVRFEKSGSLYSKTVFFTVVD